MNYSNFIKMVSNDINIAINTASISYYRRYGWSKTFQVTDFDLLISLDTSFCVEQNTQKHVISFGDYYIADPKSIIKVSNNNVFVDVLAIHFSFDNDNLNKLIGNVVPHYGRFTNIGINQFENIKTCFHEIGYVHDEKRLRLKGLTIFLLDDILFNNSQIAKECDYQIDNDSLLLSAIFYLESNLRSLISVTQLSDALNITEKKFTSLVKSKLNQTPYKFIQDYKMKKAYKLIAQGTSVKATASEIGYSDQFTFSRAFHNYFGISPSTVEKII